MKAAAGEASFGGMIDRTNADAMLATLRIIVVAMMMGVATFAVIAAVIGRPSADAPPDSNWQLFAIIVGVAALGGITAFPVVRQALVAQLRRRFEEGSGAVGDGESAASREERLAEVARPYMTLTIVAGAMAEGVGFLGCIFFILTHVWLMLIAPALAVLVLIAMFPTRSGLEHFYSEVSGRLL